MKNKIAKILILVAMLYGQIVIIDAYSYQKENNTNSALDTIMGIVMVLWFICIILFFNLYLKKRKY
jgi:hypothetical protein